MFLVKESDNLIKSLMNGKKGKISGHIKNQQYPRMDFDRSLFL